ncbi:hypothetical protein [Xylanimonas sp. McL0601]|uniref:hypothetical protein n=1 Tax=Xylanimonas sp. McL0601 TaxID=3414739 RepID=UPI003CF27CF9
MSDAFPPHLYPFRPAEHDGVMIGAAYVPARSLAEVDTCLAVEGVAPLEQRTPVLAVGSNASPSRMLWKLEQAGASTVLPFLQVRATDLTVGFSAHVSRAGYVAAAPAPAPGETTTLWCSWLDAGQLECLDATEPTYRRVDAPGSATTVPGCVPVTGAQLYVSRRGLVTDPRTGDVLPLTTQADLHEVLRPLLPALPCGDAPDVCALLAEDAELRQSMTDGLQELLRARPGSADRLVAAGKETR